MSIAASTVGGDVGEVDELAVVPLHHDALPPLLHPLQLSPLSHLLPAFPPRLSPRCLLCLNFPSHNLSLSWSQPSPLSSHHLAPSPSFSFNDGDNDGEENGADDGGPHGVGSDDGSACECSESLTETGDLVPAVD